MKETQFSPGPWEALYPPSASSCGFIASADGEEIAVIMNFSTARHCGLPDIANGHLIAAAPDLLAALRAWDKTVEGMEPDEFHADTAERIRLTRAAIAKANGVTE